MCQKPSTNEKPPNRYFLFFLTLSCLTNVHTYGVVTVRKSNKVPIIVMSLAISL